MNSWRYAVPVMLTTFFFACTSPNTDPILPVSEFDDPTLEKVVVPLHVSNGADTSTATAFIIKYKGEYLLATNYHVLTGRSWRDTTQFNEGFLREPDTVWASFQKKSDGAILKKGIPVRSGEQKFYLNVFANKKLLTTPDIAFIKISQFVRDVDFSAVTLDSVPTDLFLQPDATMYCCSYRNNQHAALQVCDTLLFQSSNGYSIKSNFTQKSAPMEGNNHGAPVYADVKGKRKLVGIASESLVKSYNTNGGIESTSNYILTKFLMKMALDSLMQKEAPEYICKLIETPEPAAISQNLNR